MQQIKLKNENVLAQAHSNHLLIISEYGWTVVISPQDAMTYLKNYFSEPADQVKAGGGFLVVNSSVVLTHKDARITFSSSEAVALLDLIRVASQEIWV
ncbi:hypothetical protein [Rheinheimera sp.]|uniref:hypothetical protein n=1 Tax=Rheinheimera sp. TaxID=1869214 RepID=UPI004047B963